MTNQTTEALAPCPFCGNTPEQRWAGPNPKASCKTDGCLGAKLPVLLLDVPEQIAAWNRRAAISSVPLTTTTQAEALACEIKDAVYSLADGRKFPDLVAAIDQLAALSSAPTNEFERGYLAGLKQAKEEAEIAAECAALSSQHPAPRGAEEPSWSELRNIAHSGLGGSPANYALAGWRAGSAALASAEHGWDESERVSMQLARALQAVSDDINTTVGEGSEVTDLAPETVEKLNEALAVSKGHADPAIGVITPPSAPQAAVASDAFNAAYDSIAGRAEVSVRKIARHCWDAALAQGTPHAVGALTAFVHSSAESKGAVYERVIQSATEQQQAVLQQAAQAETMSDDRVIEIANGLFPRWQEDIQVKFVLMLSRAILSEAGIKERP